MKLTHKGSFQKQYLSPIQIVNYLKTLKILKRWLFFIVSTTHFLSGCVPKNFCRFSHPLLLCIRAPRHFCRGISFSISNSALFTEKCFVTFAPRKSSNYYDYQETHTVISNDLAPIIFPTDFHEIRISLPRIMFSVSFSLVSCNSRLLSTRSLSICFWWLTHNVIMIVNTINHKLMHLYIFTGSLWADS